MLVTFDTIGKESRLWVYQASRSLNEGEVAQTAAVLDSFCNEWSAHGISLRASYKIDHGQFIILAVDEAVTGASGCSIDGSVKVLKSLQEKLGVDFFDRTRAAFLEGQSVRLVALKDLKDALASGILTAASPAFHTLVATKSQFDQEWIMPLEKTWLAKYLPKPAIA